MPKNDLDSFLESLRSFVKERDWNRYHNPQSLAISIAVETGELLEHVQWKDRAEVQNYLERDDNRRELAEEVADVLIYALMLTEQLGYHPLALLADKLQKNAEKYPVGG